MINRSTWFLHDNFSTWNLCVFLFSLVVPLNEPNRKNIYIFVLVYFIQINTYFQFSSPKDGPAPSVWNPFPAVQLKMHRNSHRIHLILMANLAMTIHRLFLWLYSVTYETKIPRTCMEITKSKALFLRVGHEPHHPVFLQGKHNSQWPLLSLCSTFELLVPQILVLEHVL